VAVAVAVASSCNSNSAPCLRPSICLGCSRKKQKKKKRKEKKKRKAQAFFHELINKTEIDPQIEK